MTAALQFSVTDGSAEERQLLEQGLTKHANEQTGLSRLPFMIAGRDKDGQLACGLSGFQRGSRLYISLLWVSNELRRQGAGSRLMEMAEAEARRRGCGRVQVDTVTWQAPDFYSKLGYKTMAVVEDYAEGHDRIFFEKRL